MTSLVQNEASRKQQTCRHLAKMLTNLKIITFILGETYTQLTQLLQAHVQNEVDLNPTGTCTENCAMYTSTKNYGCYDSSSEYCRKMKPCNGDLYNCRFVESHLKTCIAVSRVYADL